MGIVGSPTALEQWKITTSLSSIPAAAAAKLHQPSVLELGEIKRGGDGSFDEGRPREVLRPVLATNEHHRTPLGKK